MGGICLQCGGPRTETAAICQYCGQAAVASTQPAIARVLTHQGAETRSAPNTLVMSAEPERTSTMPPLTQTLIPAQRRLIEAGLRRPRRRTLIAVGSAAVLVIGGFVAYEVLKPQPPSADGAVRAYFSDLASGDTAAALKLVSPDAASGSSGASAPLLTATVLSSSASRPSDLAIVSSTQDPGVYGRSVTFVEVSYKLGSSAVSQDIEVAADVPDGSGAKQPYLLENPFLTLRIQDASGRPLTVNGVAVGSQDVETPVFPGVYTVQMQGDQLIAGASRTAAFASPGGGTLSADFSEPALAPGAEAAVQAQIKSALDACAQSTSTDPPTCPFSIYQSGTDDSVQWSIQTYPAATVRVSGSERNHEVEFTDDQQDGVVQYTDRYTDWFGASQTSTGTLNFSVSGYASVDGSTIQITFEPYVF